MMYAHVLASEHGVCTGQKKKNPSVFFGSIN